MPVPDLQKAINDEEQDHTPPSLEFGMQSY